MRQARFNVVCAVGNAGHLPNHPVYPPASRRRASRLVDSTTIIRSIAQNAECIARSLWSDTGRIAKTRTDCAVNLGSRADFAEYADGSTSQTF